MSFRFGVSILFWEGLFRCFLCPSAPTPEPGLEVAYLDLRGPRGGTLRSMWALILLRCYYCGRFLPCHLTNFAVHACCAQVVFHPTCDSIGACHGCWKSSSKFFKVSLRTKLNRFALPEKFHEVLKVFSQGQIQQQMRLLAGSAGSWALASAHCLSANRPAAPTTTNCRSAGTLILEQVPRTCLLSDLQAPGHMTRCAPTLGSRVELGHKRSRTDVDCNKPIQPFCAQVGFSFAEAWDRGTRLPGTRRIPHSQRRSWL